jgi:hypothetical protein
MSTKRTLILSITHKFGSDEEAEFNVGEAGQVFPDDLVPWRSITRAGKMASQPSELNATDTGPIVVPDAYQADVDLVVRLFAMPKSQLPSKRCSPHEF